MILSLAEVCVFLVINIVVIAFYLLGLFKIIINNGCAMQMVLGGPPTFLTVELV